MDINLVGLGIGNGWMVPEIQGKYAAYLFYHGFLDQQQYEALYDLEDSLVRQVRPIRGQFRDQFEDETRESYWLISGPSRIHFHQSFGEFFRVGCK